MRKTLSLPVFFAAVAACAAPAAESFEDSTGQAQVARVTVTSRQRTAIKLSTEDSASFPPETVNDVTCSIAAGTSVAVRDVAAAGPYFTALVEGELPCVGHPRSAVAGEPVPTPKAFAGKRLFFFRSHFPDVPLSSPSEPVASNNAGETGSVSGTAGRSTRLAGSPAGLFNPLPSGTMCGYVEDTGLDICSSNAPVYAIASGTLDYSELGHVLQRSPNDTQNSVRITLDAPFTIQGKLITHVYYTHLSELAQVKAEGGASVRIEAGQFLGISGIANGVRHLHLGLIVNGEVTQELPSSTLKEWDVRRALGGYAPNQALPTG